ncbi:MAG: flagellar protein FlgN [Lachnospiraceae bacterium]|nr:flagellar protein FlgN [Lachnospiraceae bacterium]
MSTSDYVVMLRESLQKKVTLLRDIIDLNEEQKHILEDPNADPDEFEANVDAKDELVQQIVALDEGFESIFKKVEDILSRDRAAYAGEIGRMQDLIREITDLSERVQAGERANANLVRMKFSSIKSQVKKVRQSRKVVNNYYNNMMNGNYYDPQFFDNKK